MSINGPIIAYIKEIGKTTRSMDMEYMHGMMAELTPAIGKIITCMVKAFTNGQMVDNMKVIISMIRSKVLEHTLIQMVALTKAIG